MWTQQCSLSRQPCFSPTTELCLMDLCLPEESGVVFLCWTMRRDGGPTSIYHLISGHKAEAIRAALRPCVLPCVDGITFHCAVLCLVASASPPLLRCPRDFSALKVTAASVEQTWVSRSQQPSTLPTYTIAWMYCTLSCLVFVGTPNNHRLSHGNLTVSQRSNRTWEGVEFKV